MHHLNFEVHDLQWGFTVARLPELKNEVHQLQILVHQLKNEVHQLQNEIVALREKQGSDDRCSNYSVPSGLTPIP